MTSWFRRIRALPRWDCSRTAPSRSSSAPTKRARSRAMSSSAIATPAARKESSCRGRDSRSDATRIGSGTSLPFARSTTGLYHPWIMKSAKLLILLTLAVCAGVQTVATPKELEAVYPAAHDLYVDLHQNPELSTHETQTAAKLAGRLRSLGYEVTEGVGGTGVVAILKNGAGPTVMLRTELDALPVEEKTGLPYASKVHAKDDSGRDVPVMHAWVPDLHMAALKGTAAIMEHSKGPWHGTLMLIGQPAEETITGADKMIKDGLFTRFPKPDFALAIHDNDSLAAGRVGIKGGPLLAGADSVD